MASLAEARATGAGSVLDRVRAIGPMIDASARANEDAAEVERSIVAMMVEAGVMGMMAPRELGGGECHPAEIIDVVKELSYWDGSAGWYAGAVLVGGAVTGAFLGPRAIAAMYAGGIPQCAGQAAPTGKAVREGDGYRISGSYSFGSGTPTADWIVGGYTVHEDGAPRLDEAGNPVMLIGFAPRANVTFKGNWNVLGLRGTGSYDFTVEDQVLHEDFFLNLGAPEQRNGGALYRMGFMATPCIAHASFAIGCARRALDEWLDFARSKQRAPGVLARDLQTFQRDFAAAEGDLRAAEAYVRQTFDRLYAAAEAGAVPDDLRLDGRLAACNAFAAGIRVVQAAYTGATTTALRNGSVIQRCFRDMHAGNAHFLTGEATLIELGKVLGGADGAQLVF